MYDRDCCQHAIWHDGEFLSWGTDIYEVDIERRSLVVFLRNFNGSLVTSSSMTPRTVIWFYKTFIEVRQLYGWASTEPFDKCDTETQQALARRWGQLDKIQSRSNWGGSIFVSDYACRAQYDLGYREGLYIQS